MSGTKFSFTLIALFVITIVGAGFGFSWLNDVSIQREAELCQEIGQLYQSEHRYSVQTGCELFVSTPQWIEVR